MRIQQNYAFLLFSFDLFAFRTEKQSEVKKETFNLKLI